MKSRTIGLQILLLALPLAASGQVLTNQTGNTLHVQSGVTLFVGGDLDNLGTLSGSGTVQATSLFGNPGTVAPGASPGMLTVTGDMSLNGTTYPCEINGTISGTDYDALAVSGAAALTGGVINVTWGFTPLVTDEFTIMSFGSRTGTPTVNVPMVGGLTFVPVYSSTSIVLKEISLPVELVSFTARYISPSGGDEGACCSNGGPPASKITWVLKWNGYMGMILPMPGIGKPSASCQAAARPARSRPISSWTTKQRPARTTTAFGKWISMGDLKSQKW